MTIVPIITAPDPILNQVCKSVEEIDKSINLLISNLFETVKKAKGAGLAAPQIGVLKRVFVLNDLSKSLYADEVDEKTEPRAIINPEITYLSGETWIAKEGCRSFPAIEKIPISRSKIIKLKYLDENVESQEFEASGWLARAIQHEVDHLNGITIINYITETKRDLILKTLEQCKETNRV